MAFHETFWAVTGAAAPVLGLAAVVSLNDLARLEQHLIDQFDSAGENLDAAEKIRTEVWMRLINQRLSWLQNHQGIVGMISVFQVLNVLAQGAVLGMSLWAIDSQQNEGNPLIALFIAVVGFCMLGLAGLEGVRIRRRGELFAKQMAEMKGKQTWYEQRVVVTQSPPQEGSNADDTS